MQESHPASLASLSLKAQLIKRNPAGGIGQMSSWVEGGSIFGICWFAQRTNLNLDLIIWRQQIMVGERARLPGESLVQRDLCEERTSEKRPLPLDP